MAPDHRYPSAGAPRKTRSLQAQIAPSPRVTLSQSRSSSRHAPVSQILTLKCGLVMAAGAVAVTVAAPRSCHTPRSFERDVIYTLNLVFPGCCAPIDLTV